MKAFAVVAFLAGALAMPSQSGNYGGSKCNPGLYSNPQCCATDVLGLLDLDCQTPQHGDARDFGCPQAGQRARCCVVPVAGQALLCIGPS
ncbi:hypothetical protein CDD82_988 [Ophiocordyceps australis]|uniref:Hydrophobin n=1 Tax=Ophiocordyceps australis TaxID=1399860 RepID=A0A2C5XPU9_9HYPO|nr:hypothetical protein CDD82_988 [Ophiocordyceps australis]